MTNAISRRTMLSAAGLTSAGAITGLSSCGFLTIDPAGEDDARGNDQGTDTTKKGTEAPELAERVRAGDLPPVQERLPKQPLVIDALEAVGQYGGTWRTAMVTQDDVGWLASAFGYEPLVGWTREWQDVASTDYIIPNYCESFRVLDGGATFEFKLREGLRWSDGEPLTAEDYRFTFEDYNVYPPLHPGGIYELWTGTDGEPAKFEIVDDWTIRYVFDAPQPGFLHEQCRNRQMALPKHYLAQFHELYNDDLDQLVREANLNDWLQLLWSKVDPWTNSDVPTLNPWIVTQSLGEGHTVNLERNPYYWKTDSEGSQLPYIDKISCLILQDIEVELLKITNGELDMQMNNFSTVRNKPVVAAGRQKGDYRIFDLGPDRTNTMVLSLNQTFPDKQWRKLFQTLDFRIGLSHAIDRQRIIDTVYAGQGRPWQLAPLDNNPVYSEEIGTQYLEYSPDLAEQAFRSAGLSDRDAGGYLTYNGRRVSIPIMVSAGFADHVDALELVKADWKAVGVEVEVQRVSDSLYSERMYSNQQACMAWTGGTFEIRATQGSNPYFVPSNPDRSSLWANQWAIWYRSDGQDGERPPKQIEHSLDLFDEMRMTYDPEAATELGIQIMEIYADYFPFIGISVPAAGYGIVSNSMRNVPQSMPGYGIYVPPGPSDPEHYWFENGGS